MNKKLLVSVFLCIFVFSLVTLAQEKRIWGDERIGISLDKIKRTDIYPSKLRTNLFISICISSVSSRSMTHNEAYSQENPNTITFDNKSGELALVKLIGPTSLTIEVSNDQKCTVNVASGEYYILIRYGREPEEYRYAKGEPFTLTQTQTQYTAVTITLHKVIGGDYDVYPIPAEEFDKTAGVSRASQPKNAVGQEIRMGQNSVFIRFGTTVAEAEKLLRAKAKTISWYKPEGSVKEMETAGITFHFENDKLADIDFGKSFAFKELLTPFTEKEFNPPVEIQRMIHRRMPIKDFQKMFDAWRSHLKKSSFHEVAFSLDSDPKKNEFYTDKRGWLKDDIAWYIVFGPALKGIAGHPRAMWIFVFDKNGALQEVKTSDGRFSLDFVIKMPNAEKMAHA